MLGTSPNGFIGAKPRGHVDDAISVSAIHMTPRLTASDEPRPLQNAQSSPSLGSRMAHSAPGCSSECVSVPHSRYGQCIMPPLQMAGNGASPVGSLAVHTSSHCGYLLKSGCRQLKRNPSVSAEAAIFLQYPAFKDQFHMRRLGFLGGELKLAVWLQRNRKKYDKTSIGCLYILCGSVYARTSFD